MFQLKSVRDILWIQYVMPLNNEAAEDFSAIVKSTLQRRGQFHTSVWFWWILRQTPHSRVSFQNIYRAVKDNIFKKWNHRKTTCHNRKLAVMWNMLLPQPGFGLLNCQWYSLQLPQIYLFSWKAKAFTGSYGHNAKVLHNCSLCSLSNSSVPWGPSLRTSRTK